MIKIKIKAFLYKIKSFFPELLPQGTASFESFLARICLAYGFPTNESYRQAVATMIMHLGVTTDRKSMRYFAKAIRKSSSNQVAYCIIEKIQSDKKKKAEAESLKLNQSRDSIPDGGTKAGDTITTGTASS